MTVLEVMKQETKDWIGLRKGSCSRCGTALWRHVEELEGHKFKPL